MNCSKSFWIAAAVIALSIALCSCNKFSVMPYIDKDGWQPQENTSIVLIGSDCPDFLVSVKLENSPLFIWTRGSYGKKMDNSFDVFGIIHKPSGKVKIKEFRYYKGADPVNMYYSTYKFPNMPEVDISSPGIYYYGTIISDGKRAFFKRDFDPRVSRYMEANYPKLFAHLERRNF